MGRLLFSMLVLVMFSSCHSDDDGSENNQDYLIFGHYYGMCEGEHCVDTYKLTSDKLFKDRLGLYGENEFEFYQLGNEMFEKIENLKTKFPEKLLQEPSETIGCPDCADGGGLLIQWSKNGELSTWRIDQRQSNVPEYLHEFMDNINAALALLTVRDSE